MLYEKRTPGLRHIRKITPFILLSMAIAVILALPACSATKGGIVILENVDGTGCRMDFKEWSARNKCELFLNKDDELQVEIYCESGEVALTISGKNGSEPYTGNHLESGIFTVTVSEADEYVIALTGKNATGSLAIKTPAGIKSQ